MRSIYLLLIITFFQGCAAKENKKIEKQYIIANSTVLYNEKDSVTVNELGISPKYTSNDLQIFLFKNYGKWDNVIEVDRKTPMLVWKNIKLFETRDELFTVLASGEDKKFETIKINGDQKYHRKFYCSAIVFNSKGADCFRPTSDLKDDLAEYFIKGLESISKGDKLILAEFDENK